METGGSRINCPHCSYGMNCKDCLWTYAISRVLRKKSTITNDEHPCIHIPFFQEQEPSCGLIKHYVPFGLHLATGRLHIDIHDSKHIRWIKGHIDWVKNMKWGLRVVKGKKNDVLGRKY